MPRLDIERQLSLEPERVRVTKEQLEGLGFTVESFGNRLEFEYNGSIVRFWPYSGWFAGKSILDGRGFKHLLKQISHG